MPRRHERWALILDRIARDGSIEVDATAREIGVSSATVRRDLDQLASQQMLLRTRGGALASSASYDLPLLYKSTRRAPEKQRIGRAAAALVPPGAVVALNGGTTTTEVARALATRPDLRSEDATPSLTVLTNALNIANELVLRPYIKTVVTGGVARPQSYELIGPLATHILAEVTVDYVMLGVDALDSLGGAGANHEGEAAINRMMVERARLVVVVADSTKLGRHAFVRVCPTERLDILVTDAAAPHAMLEKLQDAGVEVVSV